MPQFLYRIQPTRPAMLTEGLTRREEEIISQHFAYVKDLAERGVMILVGRTQTTDASTFGIAIFNADSEQAARAIMNDDPAVKHGVMSATLFPYRVALISEANAR